eukprot:scaffold5759_cov66-Phaeocystis_antarctica.AAC.3
MAGSARAPSPATSRCTPSGPAASEPWPMCSSSSAGSTDPSVPNVTRSASERPLLCQKTFFASRSSLQLRSPTLRHTTLQPPRDQPSAAAAAPASAPAARCWYYSSTARRGSSTLHSSGRR